MESNPGEAVKNNVFGTEPLAELAADTACETFVLISTDKAVNPTSVMGATKRVAELYVPGARQSSRTTRSSPCASATCWVSRGSVVPLFQEQIAARRPGDRHPPGDEALLHDHPGGGCSWCCRPAAMGKGGEVFVLDMGEPVQDRGPGHGPDPAVRASPGRGHRDRVHRHAAGREAV